MFNNLLQNITNLGLPQELIVMIVGALPISELRGAIPLAIFSFDMPWYQAFYLAFIGNLLPVPLVLLFWEKIAELASRTQKGAQFFNWVFKRTRKKEASVDRYKWLGLLLLVAIPLPLTGAWTGAILAVLLGLDFWYAFSSITIGILIAGIIVVSLSLLGWTGAIIAGISLAIIIIVSLYKKKNNHHKEATQ